MEQKCRNILGRTTQLGEELSDADRAILRAGCKTTAAAPAQPPKAAQPFDVALDNLLGRHAAAERDFGRVVDHGLSQHQLGTRLIADRSDMRGCTMASGAGAREPIVGTGTDDATDALDRRVEIKPAPADNCAT